MIARVRGFSVRHILDQARIPTSRDLTSTPLPYVKVNGDSSTALSRGDHRWRSLRRLGLASSHVLGGAVRWRPLGDPAHGRGSHCLHGVADAAAALAALRSVAECEWHVAGVESRDFFAFV